MKTNGKPKEILLVEDNVDDVDLTAEALKGTNLQYNLNTVEDGDEAMAYLRKQGKYSGAARPDIILLDLKLPKRDGHEVLAEIKSDKNLKRIPVVVLTTSQDPNDIQKAYDEHANGYVTKPVDLSQLLNVAKWIEHWLTVAKLPRA